MSSVDLSCTSNFISATPLICDGLLLEIFSVYTTFELL